jgi:hypothetical protein
MGANWNPSVSPARSLRIKKVNEVVKKAMGIINLSQSRGFFFFSLNKAYPKGRSWVVPTKQNQPHPIRPKSGEINRKKNHIRITKLITPQ